jgi:hypothetical protein
MTTRPIDLTTKWPATKRHATNNPRPVEITVVWKLHSMCMIHTRACHYHTRECQIHTYTCQNYSRVSVNHTLRVEIVLACRNRTRACINHTRECQTHTHTCQTYSRVCRKLNLYVKSHSACGNLTLRVETNLVPVEITQVRLEITLCV